VVSTDDATITASGSGNVTITAVTITDDLTLNASGLEGTLTANLGGVAGTATVTTGTVAVNLTLANAAGANAVVTLGAANGVVDQLVLGATASGAVEVTNFLAGSSGDAIDISVLGIEGRNLATGAEDLVAVGNAATSLAAAAGVVLGTVTGATDLATLATANILLVSGDFALSSMVETALELGGSRALTANGTFATTDNFLVAWDDGSNSYLGIVATANANVSTTFGAGDLTITTLVTLVGVSDVTTLTLANFGTAFIA
jgi:hypothetical protein